MMVCLSAPDADQAVAADTEVAVVDTAAAVPRVLQPQPQSPRRLGTLRPSGSRGLRILP